MMQTSELLEPGAAARSFDAGRVKRDFPIFDRHPDLVFLDSAASAQKPSCVIDGVAEYYRSDYANVHRGLYTLSARSTELFEEAREAARRFLNAAHTEEIVFVRGATEAINLVAYGWAQRHLGPGDEVLITELEHHANIVPWQLARERAGFDIRVAPIDEQGGVDLDAFKALLSPKTKLASITQLANATGAVTPVLEMTRAARAVGAKVLIDGCQAAPRMPVDVRALDCDFYVFSAHKTYGPTGIGVLYGKEEALDAMAPWQGGGDMIDTVTFRSSSFQKPPYRFEAGTPNIAGAVGLTLAIEYLERLGMAAIAAHEKELTAYGAEQLASVKGVRLIDAGPERLGMASFVVDNISPYDLATVLNQHNVAVRAGHHCAQPLIEKLGLTSTARASFGVYTEKADILRLCAAIEKAQMLFG